jgi:hypothetical protein
MTFYLEFLTKAHEILQPRRYLEIGVRYGDSLNLASCLAIGVDPAPALNRPQRPNEKILHMTSDEFFALGLHNGGIDIPVDLAFIDGMHLIENALRDFINIEKYSNNQTVVVFDDVLPYNQAIAARNQPPGDWTGDVWKMIPTLDTFRPDLTYVVVDTKPTGLLLVTGLDLDSATLDTNFADIMGGMRYVESVPEYILDRRDAVSPDEAYERIAWWRELNLRTQPAG